MKQFFMTLLCACLLLTGCRASGDSAGSPTETTKETVAITQLPTAAVDVTVPKNGLTDGEGEKEALDNTGCLRLTYTGNVSSVRYVTSVEELPDYPELQAYDALYFQEHALLLVTESVAYGSVTVGIESIRLDGDVGYVMLSHENPGDVATTVMTTWLLWAEVEKDLPGTWVVENPALQSDAERS